MAVSHFDPTRSTVLRRQFIADLHRRFNTLKRNLKNLIVTDDAFGLIGDSFMAFNAEKQIWRFQTDVGKLESFKSWLGNQVETGVLTIDGKGDPWTNKYINSAYRKGVVRAYTDTHKSELAKSLDFYEGSKARFLTDSFAAPETVSKLNLLYTRAFDQLKGISATMGQQMSRVLTTGLSNGYGAHKIARNLNNTITGIDKVRARLIARTEIVHAHAEGQLDAFERLGVEKLGAMAEWSTAGDNRVCAACADMEGSVFTIKEARGMIPLHPACRCAWLPYVPM